MANRSAQGVYSSPFKPLPEVKEGTLYDYVCGDRNGLHGVPGAEDRRKLMDWATGRTWTARQMREEVIRVAATLIETYGCRPGDHVLLCYPTCATFAILCFACQRAGLIMALANPAYTEEEMRHSATLVNAKLILTVTALKPAFAKAGISESALTDASSPPSKESGSRALYSNLVGSVQDAERILSKAGPKNVSWNDPCGIFFSSGTTGLPKAVMVSHRNLIMLFKSVSQLPGYQTPDSWNAGWPTDVVVYLPGFHIAGFATMVISAIEGGMLGFAVSAPMDLKAIVQAIKQIRPYRTAIVPPLLLAFTRLGLAGPEGFSNCVHTFFSAAAPCGPALQREAQEKLKIKVGQFWGMSETTGAVTGSDMTRDTKPGSCGQVLSGMEMKIIGEDGNVLPHGKPGEILMRGPLNMIGYYNNAKATAETVDKDGWLFTGDIGYMDDEGFLFIIDRRKELIKYKGFQVAPAELEALLLSHPAIMDVGVTGVVLDEDVGEVPRAFVVLRPDKAGDAGQPHPPDGSKRIQPDASKTATEIEEYVASRMANYKRLRGGVVFLTEIPKNPSGKILRRILRDLSKADEKARL